MNFRGYMPADFEALFALDVACFDPVYRFSRPIMRWSLEARNALVVVAHDSVIAGFVVLHIERGRVGYVVTLDVAESHRRQGLAAQLMHRVEAQARTAGCETMALHVAVANDAAIRFYERIGYARAGREPAFYGEAGDAWIYRKQCG